MTEGCIMPTYDYRCEKCRKSFSLMMTMSQHDGKKPACPKCGSRRVRQRMASFFAVTSKKS
jgi:putative FmdB family regulatory protein